MSVASAAPSPRDPPGIARWNESVAMRCRIERPAARDHVDQLEVREREEHRERHYHRDDRREQRQRHGAETLPGGAPSSDAASRAMARSSAAGEQADGDEWHAAPDVRRDDGQPRVRRLAEESM